MARRRSIVPELLMLKILAPMLIAVVGYYAVMHVVQDVAKQQIASIEAINQHAQIEQARIVEAARQNKIAAARATQAANEAYIREARLRGEAEQARQQAWYAFYQDPPGCDNWRTDTQMVACVDHKNSAKQEFDRKWAAGEIKGSRTYLQ